MSSCYRYKPFNKLTAAIPIVLIFIVIFGSIGNAKDREDRRTAQHLSNIGTLPSSDPNLIIEARFLSKRNSEKSAVFGKSFQNDGVVYIKQEWINNTWQDAERSLETHDNLGRVVENRIELRINNDGENYERTLFEYEGQSESVSVEILQIWEEENWENYWRDQYFYDAQGQLIEIIWEDWDIMEDDWLQTDLFELSYDAEGNLTDILIYWRFDEEWELDSRETWSYDDAGNLTSILVEFIDNEEWWNEFRILLAYDESGNNIADTTQSFNETNEEWVYESNSRHEFDGQGNRIESIRQSWENNEWVNAQRDTYEYTTINELNIHLVQVWTGNNWANFDRYLYGDPAVSVAENGNIPERFELMQNYPNPFNPSTTIQFVIPEQSHVMLVIYDLLGREVATLVDGSLQPGEYSYIFDAGHLASGVYLYRLRSDDLVSTKRFILMK